MSLMPNELVVHLAWVDWLEGRTENGATHITAVQIARMEIVQELRERGSLEDYWGESLVRSVRASTFRAFADELEQAAMEEMR